MSEATSGKDTLQIDSRIMADFADADAIAVEFDNDIGVAKAAKNGNTLYAKDERGRMGTLTARILVGSADHKYLNSRFQAWLSDESTFIKFTAIFCKRVGDGAGNVSTVVYNCTGGIPKKQPKMINNVEGNTEQNVMPYMITFGNVQESIQ